MDVSCTIVVPTLGKIVKLLVAQVPYTSRNPTIVPSIGDVGRVIENALTVVLTRTNSLATAVYGADLIDVGVNPPPADGYCHEGADPVVTVVNICPVDPGIVNAVTPGPD